MPGPWSEAAKALFRHHGVAFLPVRQDGGRDNPELVAWTGHRNAPIAMYNDEPPRVRWLEILDLAERLGDGESLYPSERENRMFMVGLTDEIAGERGFAWNARLLMLDEIYQAVGEKAHRNPMLKEYRYSPESVAGAVKALNEFLGFMADHVSSLTSRYLVGDQLTAADIYWAYFSNLVAPQSEDDNPMPGFLRKNYELPATLLEPIDGCLVDHRDWIFHHHLQLPVSF